MAPDSPLISTTIYFSFNQFMVFDKTVRLPGCAWVEEHTRQGFARRDGTVNFGTLLEFGQADVVASHGPYAPNNHYDRVVEVPFEVCSGQVVISAPEESNDRVITLPQGHYRLVAAQRVTNDDDEETYREAIDLYFEPVSRPLAGSRIIVADGDLHPSTALLETADVAE